MNRFHTRSLRALVLLSTLALFGCPPEETGDNNDNNTNNTTGTNNTAGTNNTNNTTGTNNTTPTNNTSGTNNDPGFDVDVDEVEPNDQVDPEEGTDEATPFTAGDSIGGALNNDDDATPDFDIYKVELTGGTVFNWEITGTGPGVGPEGLFTFILGFDSNIRRELSGGQGASRGAFIPADGTYYLAVSDPRPVEEGEADNDAPGATYSISTSVGALSPTAATFPGQNTGDLADGLPDAYSLTASGDTVLAAETFAERAPVESGLDTVLYVWDVAASAVIASNDDEGDSFDSALTASLTDATDYLVIVESYAAASDADYNLELGTRDDSPTAPRDLAVGTPIDDGIADLGGGESDADYFAITLQPGDTTRVRVDAAAAGQLVPNINVFVLTADGAEAVDEARAAGAAAAVTLHVPSGGAATDFIVVVDDQRNIDNEGDTPLLGGADYGYSISAAAETWAAATGNTDPATSNFDTLQLGSITWYEYALTTGDVVTFERLATFPDGLADADLLSTLLTDEGVSVGPGAASYVASTDGNVWIGMREVFWRGADGANPYDVVTAATLGSIAGVTFNAVTSDNTNTTQANGLTLSSGDVVNGQVVGTDEDTPEPSFNYFSVTLNLGDVLTLVTEADPDAPLADPADPASVQNADTVIRILNADGDEVATNDEILGAETPGFSALAYRAGADGTYTIVVEPYYFAPFDFYFDGYYLLKVNVVAAVN
jgi:hypothetical protein